MLGATEEEAIGNGCDALRECLSVVVEPLRAEDVGELDVTLWHLSRIAGVNYLDAARALEKAGFRIVRREKHSEKTLWMAKP